MKRKDENALKKYVVSQVLKGYGHIQSHEDKYTSGIPDLDYCLTGVAGWIELKIIQEWPVKSGTKLNTALRHLTNDQMNWMKQRSKAGGKCFVLLKVMKTKEYLLYRGDDARRLKDSGEFEAKDLALKQWQGTLPSMQLIAALTE